MMSAFKNCLIMVGCAIGAMAQAVTTGGGTVGTIPVFSGSSSIDNSNMFQFRARIGINTTSPLGTLHVSQDGNTALVLQDTTVANSALWYFAPSALSLSSDTFGIIRSEGGNSVESKSLFITNAGNVGIGITSPTQKLVVEGNINIAGSGAGLIFPDGSVQTKAQVQGPAGPAGPQGPPGPVSRTSSAVCSQQPPSCSNGFKVSPVQGGQIGCFVSSDTGSCQSFGNNWCTVCN